VGEIWVSGASVARGYWNQPAATEDTFQAHLADGINPYLRTGDLGFVHHDNELFIVGRSKDVIIIWGRNYFPQDIELTVEECHDALRPGCGAAFSVEISGEERLVIVQELERSYLSARHLGSGTDHHLNRQATPDHDPPPLNPAELFERIRSTVAEQHQLAIHAIALIKAGTISKTSSGKIQRQACRTLFLTGGLNVRHEWRASADQPPMEYVAPRIPEEEKVAEIFAQVLNLPRVGIHDNFFELGGDSILAIAVATCLREVLQVDLPLHVLYETPTVARLAVGVAKVQAVR
jgi:acyl carrier protein